MVHENSNRNIPHGSPGVNFDEDHVKFDKKALYNVTREQPPEIEEEVAQVYIDAMTALNEAGVPYVVGAAFARYAYTGVWRHTKDLDLFLRPTDLGAALHVLEAAAFRISVEFEHWLSKAYRGENFIDLIFGTGHGQVHIDDLWLGRSLPGKVLGVPVRIASIEDVIVSACYIAERTRFDGSDIVHLILVSRGRIDWAFILERLGENRELLLWHLLLFDFIYPGQADCLPQELMVQLFDQIQQRWSRSPTSPKAFRGLLLDPFSFTVDVQDWGYEDRRDLTPLVNRRGEAL